jgi:hypothetical protein
LAIDAERSGDANLLVDRLGSAHTRYTFWFFAALQLDPDRIILQPNIEQHFQALQVRLKNDPELMTMWIQFLGWRHDKYFIALLKMDRESALARVELAQIFAMPDGDNRRRALIRWMGENNPEVGTFRQLNPPTLPFPGWSGPVLELP